MDVIDVNKQDENGETLLMRTIKGPPIGDIDLDMKNFFHYLSNNIIDPKK